MLKKILYSIAKKNVTRNYIDISLSFIDSSRISFSFFYRINGSGSWNDDAIIETVDSSIIKSNIVSSADLDSDGECVVRWHYRFNGVSYYDDVEIEIRPEPYANIFSYHDDKSSQVELNSYGAGGLSLSSGKRFSGLTHIVGNSLYFNGSLVTSSLSNPSFVDEYKIGGSYYFIVADTGNNRVVEINQNGSSVIEKIVVGETPVYCTINRSNGNVLYVDSTGDNIIELNWRNPSTWSVSGAAGTVVWDYNTSFPSNALTSPLSATYGVGDNVIVSDTDIVKIDRDKSSISKVEGLGYKRSIGIESENKYSPTNLFVSFEFDENRYLSLENTGELMPYLNTSATHTTYNRELKNDSAFSVHRGLENDLLYPIVPAISDEINVTITSLNGDALSSSMNNAYITFGRVDLPLKRVSGDKARGNIYKERLLWGVSEAYNRGVGTQTFVCTTGQQINFKLSYSGTKIGYALSGIGADPVYVSEAVTVTMTELISGVSTEVYSNISLSADDTFSFVADEASASSYTKSSSIGAHAIYSMSISVTESYYKDSDFGTVSSHDPRTYEYNSLIYSFWWRQILKEANASESPVSDYGFDLEDYSETPAAFFGAWTSYPDFYRVVGGTTLTLSNAQKEKIIRDNALALLSYKVSVLPGDSAFAKSFGLNPVSYVDPVIEDVTHLHRADLSSRTISQDLPGLDAQYQMTNVFEEEPTISGTFNQFVRSPARSLFANSERFHDCWGENGMETLPYWGTVSAVRVTIPESRKRISISIDKPTLFVDTISLTGESSNSDKIGVDDQSLKASFTTISSPDKVVMGVSVDGGPYSTYTDPSGTVRDYIFDSPQTITSQSMVEAFIELTDTDGKSYIFYATKKVFSEERVSAIDGIRVEVDKKGKRLVVNYDLTTKYDWVPYSIAMSVDSGSGYVDMVDSISGDFGSVVSGLNRTIILNYGQVFTATVQKERMKLKLDLTSLVTAE